MPQRFAWLGRGDICAKRYLGTPAAVENGGVQFDLIGLPEGVASSLVSRVHACIGFDPARGWVIVNGGPASEGRYNEQRKIDNYKRQQDPNYRQRAITYKWLGQKYFWCRAITPPEVAGETVAVDRTLRDGDFIVFVRDHFLEICAAFSLNTLGGESSIEHITFNGVQDIATAASLEPLSHIPDGAQLKPRKPEYDSLSRSSSQWVRTVAQVNNLIDDTAKSAKSWMVFMALLMIAIALVVTFAYATSRVSPDGAREWMELWMELFKD